MDKERLVQIGKFLNDRLIIHRNVENNTPWTTEEKMIQELYDNYLELLIKYKEQKEIIDDCKEDISNLLDIIGKNCNELKCTSDEWLVIQKYQNKEVSE